jgi:secondary thiamine-phosphate synthase enzyme
MTPERTMTDGRLTQAQERLAIRTRGQGLTEITREVARVVAASGVSTGLCTVFITHTSASLTIQENADPSARRDLERFLERLVPEGDPHYTHTAEGPDDMPSHIRSALTATTLSVPVTGGRMALGTWQGIYVWEHRRRGSERDVVVHVLGSPGAG